MRVTTTSAVAVALVALLACAGAAFGARELVNHQTLRAAGRQHAAETLGTDLFGAEAAATTVDHGGGASARQRFAAAGHGVARALTLVGAADRATPSLEDALIVLDGDARRWESTIEMTQPNAAQGATLTATRTAQTDYDAAVRRVDRSAVDTSEWLGAGLVTLVAALAIAMLTGLYRLLHRELSRRRERVEALRELMQVSASEADSRRLLLRHAAQVAPGTGVALLSRIESQDQLEPTFGEGVSDTPLRAMPLGRLSADSCLAIHLARGHRASAPDTNQPAAEGSQVGNRKPHASHSDLGLRACELCGRLPGAVTCEPIRFGGRTLGALLITGQAPLREDAHQELHEAIGVSAPVLALQRAMDANARRAAIDPLTGLPNRLAAEDAMKRLSAQAGRTIDPLAAVLVDIDHFQTVNDRFGFALGDATLKVVANVLSAHIRASDFIARYGGEEFLVLAPSTDRTGAAELAEKLRAAIQQTEIQVIGGVTASFGVAALPENALEPSTLMREADRAVFVAKQLGRNRVQEADPTATSEG